MRFLFLIFLFFILFNSKVYGLGAQSFFQTSKVQNTPAVMSSVEKVVLCGNINEGKRLEVKCALSQKVKKNIGEQPEEIRHLIAEDSLLSRIFEQKRILIIENEEPWVFYESASSFALTYLDENGLVISSGLLNLLLKRDKFLLAIILEYGSRGYAQDVLALQSEYLAEEVLLLYAKEKNQLEKVVFDYMQDLLEKRYSSNVEKQKQLRRIIEISKKANSDISQQSVYEELCRGLNLREPFVSAQGFLEEKLEAMKPKVRGMVRCGDIVFLPADAKIYVVSDIHGDGLSLDKITSQMTWQENEFLVFTGDCVNNGLNSIETILKILKLKMDHPNNFVILNGNHEFRETFLTAMKECFKTHWDNAVKAPFLGKEPPNHYNHVRLEFMSRFGVERGEELYRFFETWGQNLPYVCFSTNGIMMSHSIGKIGKVSFRDLAISKEIDAGVIKELGYEGWKKASSTLHSTMVNNRDIKPEYLAKFEALGVQRFVVGHSHFRSGVIAFDGRLITICSSFMASPQAGHYMFNEMILESRKNNLENVRACYLMLDNSLNLAQAIRPVDDLFREQELQISKAA